MIPFILAAVGGYLIGESSGVKLFDRGGQINSISGSDGEKMNNLKRLILEKINAQNGQKVKAKIITDNNSMDDVKRYAMSSNGEVIEMIAGKKRFGRLLVYSIPDISRVTGIQFYESGEEKTYAEDLRTMQNFIKKNRHPNLWDNIGQEYNFSNLELQRFADATRGMSRYDSWNLAPDYNMPRLETHFPKGRTITMDTVKMPKYAQEDLKRAIEEKREYRYNWDCGYDCSVSTKMGEDGIYRGWFSQEYKGLGNGYYWLLISPTQAIFAEKD